MKTTKRLWKLIQFIAEREVKKRFDFSFETFNYDKIEGPLFIIPNHVTAWDPLLIGLTTGGRRLSFVASEHVLRVPWLGNFLKNHMDIIPHRKAGGGTLSVKECLKRAKEGEAIFIASEGEQSWDGESYKVVPTTGKLIKKSGATVVTVLIEGGYLAKPRWADNTRKGRVHIRPVNVYTPEKIATMTPEEIMDAISNDIHFNIWEWQKGEKQNKYIANNGGIAEGAERLFYICPRCEEIGSLTSSGSEIKCRCGYKVAILETGFLDPIDPFETIKEWSDWQDKKLNEIMDGFPRREMNLQGSQDDAFDTAPRKEVSSANPSGAIPDMAPSKEVLLFKDASAELSYIDNEHNEHKVSSGEIALVFGGDYILSVGGSRGKQFLLTEIDRMAMILFNRIVFSSEGMYYELRMQEMKGRTNLRKYLVAWKNINKD